MKRHLAFIDLILLIALCHAKLLKSLTNDGLYEVTFTIAGALSVEKMFFSSGGNLMKIFHYAGWEDAEFAFRTFHNGVKLLYDVKILFFIMKQID